MESENKILPSLKSVFLADTIIKYSKKNNAVLFILPLVLGVLAWLYYSLSINFYTTYADSTYIYLINGANIANGHLDLGHYDNPGTTAHWLAGIIIFFTHLFFGKGDIIEDVINRPEFYLRADTVVCIALIMISTYAAGKLIAKNTGNYITAIFFQLIAISAYLNVHFMVRVCPEYLMIMMLPYYCAFLWALSYKKSQLDGFTISTKSILFLAFVTAALLIAKITCLPFILIPLFFIEKPKKIIVYLTSVAVFALLILYPVWNSFRAMYKWFFGMATHTGKYGSGQDQIIDKAEYIQNLKTLFTDEWFFTTGFIILTVLVLLGLFTKKWKNVFFRLATAFWLVTVFQIILAAKHYSFHYLIPSRAVTIPAVLAGLVAFPMQFNFKKIITSLALITCTACLLYKFDMSATDYWGGNNQYKSSIAAAKQFGDMPKIITTTYEESCFVESALNFGAAYGGSSFENGRIYLRKKYPTSFFYEPARIQLHSFFKEVQYSDVFEKYPEIMVNFLRKDEAYKKNVLDNITAEYKYAVKNIELARNNWETGDDFYVIHIDTALAKPHYNYTVTINFDFEKTTEDKSNFISTDGLFTCGNADLSSKEQYTSAVKSLKAGQKHQYVAWATFGVRPGDGVEITVNRYAEDNAGGVILTSINNKSFEKISEEVIADLGKGWKKILLKAKITSKFVGNDAGVCFFHFGDKDCYFDDLTIKVLKK